MKNFMVLEFLAFLSVQAAPAFGLVRLMANCTTGDGLYSVSITDNQGTGMDRSTHYEAVIYNGDHEQVGSYDLYAVNPTLNSQSYGAISFADTETAGQNFVFDYPTKHMDYSLRATLADGSRIQYGAFKIPASRRVNCSYASKPSYQN